MFTQPRAPPAVTNEYAPNYQHHQQQPSSGASSYYTNTNGNGNGHGHYASTSSNQSFMSASAGSGMSANNDESMQQFHQVFCNFLDVQFAPVAPDGINKAREKLMKLPQEQFSELATDVHDELQRRISPNETKPMHLPPQNNLHPKRNQGREKLSILPPKRFADLCADILYGIETRYPNVAENHRNQLNANETSKSPDNDQPQHLAAEEFTFTQHDPVNSLEEQHQQDPEHEHEPPVAQPLQQTTIVPTKGTLVEEDDDDDDSDDDLDGDDFEGDTTTTLDNTLNRGSVALDSIAEEPNSEGNNGENIRHQSMYSNRFSQDYLHKRDISGQITPPDHQPNDNNEFSDDENQTRGIMNVGYTDQIGDQNISDQIKDRDEQIQMLVEEGSRMDETINKLEAQLAESEELKNSLVDENGRLHELVSELERVKESNLDKLNNLQQQYDELKTNQDQQLSDYQDQLREVEEKLADAEAQNLSLNEKHADLLNKQNEYNDESAKLNKTITDLHKQISDHEAVSCVSNNDVLTISEQKISELKADSATAATAAAAAAVAAEAQPKSVSLSTDEGKEELQKKYDNLKKDHMKLNKELEQQQKVTDQVREEASSFLEEMRMLASNQTSWDSTQSLQTEVQKLKVQVQEWKSRYLRAKSQVRNARSSTYGNRNLFQPSAVSIEKGSPYYDEEHGMIRDNSVHTFQIAMEDFLIKSRTDVGNLLDHLHHLVVAARGISQDINDGSIDSHDKALQSEIAQCNSMVSTTANHLITTTRNHMTSGGLAPIAVLDAAASDLSSAVIELVKVAKIRPQNSYEQDGNVLPPRPDSSGFENGATAVEDRYYDGDVDNSINDIDSSVVAPLSTTNTTEPAGATRSLDPPQPVSTAEQDSTYITAVSSPVQPAKPKSQVPELQSPIHYNEPITTKSKSPADSAAGSSSIRRSINSSELMSPTDVHKDVEEHRITVKDATARRTKRFASQLSHDQISPGRFDIHDPDNTVAELQAYLEQKTLGVIDAIQGLLTGLRSNSKMGELRIYIDSIITSVKKMVEATGNSMKQTRNYQLKDKGGYILANLDDCTQRMINLKTNSVELGDDDAPGRDLKQRFAGLSFDMTKCTKELVKTVEEVSLTAEIQDIDEQLAM